MLLNNINTIAINIVLIVLVLNIRECETANAIGVDIKSWFETPDTNNGKWGRHWTMATKNPNVMKNGHRDIASHYYPLIGPYASGDPDVIDWQLCLMTMIVF